MMSADRPSLLVVAHGSGEPNWAYGVEEFVDQIRALPDITQTFRVVEVGYLEKTEPFITDVLERHLQSGPGHIWVLPLFLVRSTHFLRDLPVALGLKSEGLAGDEDVKGGQVVDSSHGRVTLLDPFANPDLMAQNVVRRLRERELEPNTGGVVLYAHGANLGAELWRNTLSKVARRVKSEGYCFVKTVCIGGGDEASLRRIADALVETSTWGNLRVVEVVSILVSVGRIQQELVAKACDVARATVGHVVIRHRADAVLPDLVLAKRVAADIVVRVLQNPM